MRRRRRVAGRRSPRFGSIPTRFSACTRARSRPFDDDLVRLLERMKRLMADASGVGLAGDAGRRPPARRVLQSAGEEGPRRPREPAHRRAERGVETDDEGCLSLRASSSPSSGLARHARGAGRRRRGACGSSWTASTRASSQHELDHLDGVLILDRTTPEHRREALGDRSGRAASSSSSRGEALVPLRIGVAATAPFGADVLERLAAQHDVAFAA